MKNAEILYGRKYKYDVCSAPGEAESS